MGDADSLPAELLAHAAFVRRLARSLLADEQAAEDVAQETWRAACEHPPARPGDARSWLGRVVRNFARRNRRSEARRLEREHAGAREEALPASDALLGREETLQRVVSAVNALEEPYRATILRRFYEDLPPREIARRAGVSVETVNTRLKRGLARLRGALASEQREWRQALGLLAGDSPCLPTAFPVGGALLLMKTKTVLVSALALSLLGLGVWRAVAPPHRSTPVVAGGADRSEVAEMPEVDGAAPLLAPAAKDSDRRAAGALQVPAEAALSGRVVDLAGAPVSGVEVHVLGTQDPFAPDHPAERIGWNFYQGRTFRTDDEGNWRAILPAPGRVFVTLGSAESYEYPGEDRELSITRPAAGAAVQAPENAEATPHLGAVEERWIDAPAAGIDFVVRRIPTGTLEIRVVEGASRRPVASFSGAVRGDPDYRPRPGEPAVYTGGYYSFGTRDGVVRRELRVDSPQGRRLLVTLGSPSAGNLWEKLFGDEPPLEQEVLLLSGATLPVTFVIPERGVVRGFVVDAAGTPVPGALVFFGEETRVRGDEPFQPVRETRVSDGARSGVDGWFELRGSAESEPFVTAVHPEHSGATVPTRQASRIVLGPRGALRGRLVDAGGVARPGVSVWLDEREQGAQDTTDVAGRFAFEGVEAGAHALGTEGEWPLVCVRLAAGEQAEVELRAPGPGGWTLELSAPGPLGPPELGDVRGLVIGRERTFDLREVRAGPEPGTLVTETALRPGRYWLATRQGILASFECGAEGERVRVALGDGELVVRSAQRVFLQVVPSDADPFLRLMAARLYLRVDAESEGRFRLQPGRYLLVTESGAVLRAVEVPAGGVTVELP